MSKKSVLDIIVEKYTYTPIMHITSTLEKDGEKYVYIGETKEGKEIYSNNKEYLIIETKSHKEPK